MWQRPSVSESEVAVRDVIVPQGVLNKIVTDMYGWFAVFEAADAQNHTKTVNSSIFSMIATVKKMRTFEGFLLISHRQQKNKGFPLSPSKIDVCLPYKSILKIKFSHLDLLQWAAICCTFEMNIPLYLPSQLPDGTLLPCALAFGLLFLQSSLGGGVL